MAGGVVWKEPDVERLKDAVAKTPKNVEGDYWVAVAKRFNKKDANGRNGPIVERTANQCKDKWGYMRRGVQKKQPASTIWTGSHGELLHIVHNACEGHPNKTKLVMNVLNATIAKKAPPGSAFRTYTLNQCIDKLGNDAKQKVTFETIDDKYKKLYTDIVLKVLSQFHAQARRDNCNTSAESTSQDRQTETGGSVRRPQTDKEEEDAVGGADFVRVTV